MSTATKPLVSLRAIDGKLYDLRTHLQDWKAGGMWRNDEPVKDEFVNPLHVLELIDELLLLRYQHTTTKETA